MKGPVQTSSFICVKPSVTFRYMSRLTSALDTVHTVFGQAACCSIRKWQSNETAKFEFYSDVQLCLVRLVFRRRTLLVPTIMYNINYLFL